MDDNDEEGDYNGDFYAKLPEGAEEPRLPTFQNFSFEANPAAEAGSSIAQQSTQADGGQQDPQPEPDDVNDDSVPVQGGDEDENGGEEPVTYEAQDRAVGQFMQQVIQNVQQRHPAGHGQQHTAPVHLQQPSAQTQQLASTLPPGRQRLRVERTNAEFDTQDQRIDYWLRRGSSHLLGDRPREAEQQAMTADGWRARYGNMSAAERLAHDIPTPPGQPPAQQRTKRKWWSPEGGGGDDDDDYKSLDEGDENFTTYIPEQAYVAENNLPYLMGIREIDPTLPAANDPEVPGMLTENGRAVLGPRGAQLRNLPILPRRIGDKCPGWLIEAWMRYDKRVIIQDIADRLPRAKKRPIKPAIDYRERKGLFMKSQKQRKNVKEENAARDFIIATKTDCKAADILDPPAPRSETDDQRRERVESLRQKIFRNTVWEFHRDRNGVIRGIKQPGGVSGAHFPLPPLAGLDATRLRAASAKRNQLRTYSIAEGNSTKWEAFAARYPEICWGHRRTGKGPAEDDTNNASETSMSAADPSTQGDHNTAFIPTSGLNIAAEENSNPSTAEEAMAALSRARNRQGARSRANADPSTVLSTHTGERSNQAKTGDDQTEDDFDPGTEAPESTTEDQQKQPPKDARICFDFVEDEVLHRLELQALANLRFRAVLGIPEWVQRQLNQLSQEQQGTDAGEQEQEDTFGPRQTVDIVREAVRAGREAIRLNVFRNQNWRYNHNNLQSDRESNNRVLVFRSAITLLTILRHQTKDNIMSALDENDEDLLAMYAGENEQARKVRDEFACLVTRHYGWWRNTFFGHRKPRSTKKPIADETTECQR
ncbi:hypothetical protein BFW01_g2043 [Lasiodiplodia theobromae]|nr:hypothetical protein BFW01_g2043 [Lasiodiplodia theobromae]